MAAYREYRIQLKDALTGKAIISAGGKVLVVESGDASKQTIYSDAQGTPATNPMTPTRGFINFFVPESVDQVDLYIQAPGGQFVVVPDVTPSGPNEIAVDTNARMGTMVIPFSMDDYTANTESDTGFDEPAGAIMLPHPAVNVLTADSTETINVGTDSNDSGDADGFIAAVSVGTQGLAKATIANGANTLGALFEVQDSANSGDLTHEGHVSGGKSITLTLSAGSDTAEGFIHLPYMLCGAV